MSLFHNKSLGLASVKYINHIWMLFAKVFCLIIALHSKGFLHSNARNIKHQNNTCNAPSPPTQCWSVTKSLEMVNFKYCLYCQKDLTEENYGVVQMSHGRINGTIWQTLGKCCGSWSGLMTSLAVYAYHCISKFLLE